MLRLPTNQIAGFLKVQYLTNEVRDETDFLYADKHLRFARIQLYFTCSQWENIIFCMFIGEMWPKWFRDIFLKIVKKIFFTTLVKFNNYIALCFIFDYIIFRLRFQSFVF